MIRSSNKNLSVIYGIALCKLFGQRGPEFAKQYKFQKQLPTKTRSENLIAWATTHLVCRIMRNQAGSDLELPPSG